MAQEAKIEEEDEVVVTPDEDEDQGDQSSGSEEDNGEEAEEYSKRVQKRIDSLVRKQREAEEQLTAIQTEKMTVEEFARRALEENKTLKARLDSTTDTAYEAFGQSMDAEIAAAKAAVAKAYEDADGNALADAQDRLASAHSRKAQVSARPKRQAPPQQAPNPEPWRAPQQRPQPQPVKVSDTTREWAKNNTWFQAPGKERLTGMAMMLHQEAAQQGFDVESEEYFSYIDENMRKTFPDEFEASASKATQPRVAGASRSGGRKRVDSITESEASLCKRMGIDEKKYLEQKRKLTNG